MESKEKYMRKALFLAEQGGGYVNPNPLVGAVVVKKGRVVGQGYHREFGGPHAEVNALQEAGSKARSAELYVSLEPCVHEAKTPPCVDLILEKGIEKVYVACLDPNPRVDGKGVEKLREEGVEVQVGMLEQESRRLNEIYFKYIRTGSPFVQLKLAMSLDGKIATRTGDSKWISGEKSRENVHHMRARFSSVLVGIETVLSDDPRLTVRDAEGPHPSRFILDEGARIPGDSRLLADGVTETVVVTGDPVSEEDKLDRPGVSHWRFPAREGEIDLPSLMDRLGEEGYDSLLVEGGSEVAWSFLKKGLVDKCSFFISPKIIGGAESVPAVGGKGFASVKDSLKLVDSSWQRSGEDFWCQAYPAEER